MLSVGRYQDWECCVCWTTVWFKNGGAVYGLPFLRGLPGGVLSAMASSYEIPGEQAGSPKSVKQGLLLSARLQNNTSPL